MKKSNNIDSDSFFSPIAWWLHAGDRLRGVVLVIGGIDSDSIHFISRLAKKLYIYESSSSNDTGISYDNVDVIGNELKNSLVYDAIIIKSLDNHERNEELSFLFSKCLSHDGVICLYEKNSYNFKNFVHSSLGVIKNIFYKKRYKKISSILDGSSVSCFPTISYERIPYESFVEGQYISNKNTFLLKERVRTFILRSRFSRLFTNTNIWVIQKNNSSRTLVDILLEELPCIDKINFKHDLKCSIIYYKFGKIIIVFSDVHENKNNYVAVIAIDSEAVKQRENERISIRYLLKNEMMKKYIQEEHIRHSILGFNCFVMKMYKGITVDINNTHLQKMTTNVYPVLEILSSSTIHNMDNKALKNKINQYAKVMKERLSNHLDDINIVTDFIINNISKHNFKSVCMHGDLKLENFVLDYNYQVVGVIDWELCEIDGVPLIDLYYLIGYNHQIIMNNDFAYAFVDLCDNNLEKYEIDMINKYCKKLGIKSNTKPLILAIFFMHHYSLRFYLDQLDGESNSYFMLSLNRIISLISE